MLWGKWRNLVGLDNQIKAAQKNEQTGVDCALTFTMDDDIYVKVIVYDTKFSVESNIHGENNKYAIKKKDFDETFNSWAKMYAQKVFTPGAVY